MHHRIYDELTGEVGAYTVTATISHVDEDIVHLTIDGELIETTAEHPFYTDDGIWVDAADLEVGEQLLSLDGDYGTVEAVEVAEDVYQPMYNLTVDEAHTFAVGDGAWVVHNVGCDYGKIDPSNGKRSGIHAILTSETMKPKRSAPTRQVNPPGYVSGIHNKGHLLAASLGGSNSKKENFVTLYPQANQDHSTIEGIVKDYVMAGGTVDYRVTPIYVDSYSTEIPLYLHVRALGIEGYLIPQSNLNPAIQALNIDVMILNRPFFD